jgi:hypothetical protein
MKHVDTALAWHTSSHSNGEGSCVECAETPGGTQMVRDTKDRLAGTFEFSAPSWAAFVDSVRGGHFTTKS